MVSFNPPKPQFVEVLQVTWNGTMDHDGTCPRLTGGIDRPQSSGEKPRERAERMPYQQQRETFARAKREIERAEPTRPPVRRFFTKANAPARTFAEAFARQAWR